MKFIKNSPKESFYSLETNQANWTKLNKNSDYDSFEKIFTEAQDKMHLSKEIFKHIIAESYYA